MNWKKIKENYPKALKAAVNWFSDNPVSSDDFCEIVEYSQKSDYLGTVYFRELYDFFDKNEIRISINPNYQCTRSVTEDFEKAYLNFEDWYYDIHSVCFHEKTQGLFKTRQEAEMEAFEKAFELLEQKLTNNK